MYPNSQPIISHPATLRAFWRAGAPPVVVPNGSAVPPAPAAPPARRRLPWGARAALAALALLSWWLLPGWGPEVPGAGTAAPWELHLSADGAGATPVLVFGRSAGIHLVRVHPADGVRRTTVLPAPVADGNVWMISLGRAPLVVRGQGGEDSPVMSFGAQGRVIEAFHRPSGSGVRTW